MPNREYNTVEKEICGGCSKCMWVAVGYVCKVYEFPRKSSGYRLGECAFNPKTRTSSKSRVRAGQQKTKRAGA
jgi:hypothetical protein